MSNETEFGNISLSGSRPRRFTETTRRYPQDRAHVLFRCVAIDMLLFTLRSPCRWCTLVFLTYPVVFLLEATIKYEQIDSHIDELLCPQKH